MIGEKIPDFFSRVIMNRLKINYSHAAILYKDTIYHAIKQGVLAEKLSDLPKNDVIVHEKEIELKVSEDYFLGFMAGVVGTDYSETQLLGFLFDGIRSKVTDGRTELICSEFVAWVLQEMSDYKFDENLDFVDPKDLWTMLNKS